MAPQVGFEPGRPSYARRLGHTGSRDQRHLGATASRTTSGRFAQEEGHYGDSPTEAPPAHQIGLCRPRQEGAVPSRRRRRTIPPVISQYLAAALRKARYEILPDDSSYYGEIPAFDGVYANASTPRGLPGRAARGPRGVDSLPRLAESPAACRRRSRVDDPSRRVGHAPPGPVAATARFAHCGPWASTDHSPGAGTSSWSEAA